MKETENYNSFSSPKSKELKEDESCEWFSYLSKHKTVPEGWEMIDDLKSCCHGHHAVLIRKCK